jgi:hypothetical protein
LRLRLVRGQHLNMPRNIADNPQGGRTFPTFRSRTVDRLLARAQSWRLDSELAEGRRPPEWSPLHAVRADYLESPAFRTELADNWDRVLGIATGRVPGTRNSRAVLRRDQVVEAEPQIRELTTLLRSSTPLPARGVASAQLLLTDGTGPLYNCVSDTVLANAVAAAIALFDPAQPPISLIALHRDALRS